MLILCIFHVFASTINFVSMLVTFDKFYSLADPSEGSNPVMAPSWFQWGTCPHLPSSGCRRNVKGRWINFSNIIRVLAEHLPCKAPWSGTPCRTTSAHSRTMSPLDSTWKPGFSLATSVLSELETSWQLRYICSHFYHYHYH